MINFATISSVNFALKVCIQSNKTLILPLILHHEITMTSNPTFVLCNSSQVICWIHDAKMIFTQLKLQFPRFKIRDVYSIYNAQISCWGSSLICYKADVNVVLLETSLGAPFPFLLQFVVIVSNSLPRSVCCKFWKKAERCNGFCVQTWNEPVYTSHMISKQFIVWSIIKTLYLLRSLTPLLTFTDW